MDYKLYISTEIEKLLKIRDSNAESALKVFYWMREDFKLTSNFEESNYKILTYDEYTRYMISSPALVRSLESKWYLVFKSKDQLNDALSLFKGSHYRWVWKYSKDHPTYEVTSRGDRRYSPFFQNIKYNGNWMTLEAYYHKVIKPTKNAGTYIEGTGHQLMRNYLFCYPGLIYELAEIGTRLPFSDMFDKSGGQNKWYVEILNEYINNLK